MNTLPFLRGQPGHFVWQAIELRSARAARWARAATSAQERSARSGKQSPRHCLEVWSFLSLRRMDESSAGDFTVGKIQKTSAVASCKNVRSTEKEYHSHIINSL